jgi:tetratricopeptide (TPR) repeat protein
VSGYKVTRFDELEAIPVAEGLVWHPVRRRLGITAFGINAYTAEEVGGHVVERHTEEQLGHEEVYLVVSGRARFLLGDDVVDAPAGTMVFLRDPAVQREATAEEPDTLVLAIGGKPGAPYETSAWETMFFALPAVREERWDDAIALHEEALREQPDHPRLLYNLACLESRGGRHEEALLHLQQAVRLDRHWAGPAQEDTDFDAIRELPGFPTAQSPTA